MNCSLPGSSICGVFQAILEWFAISYSRGSSQPKDHLHWQADSLPLALITWRRAWQPTPVFLPGESHGQRSLAGYSTYGQKESNIRTDSNVFFLMAVLMRWMKLEPIIQSEVSQKEKHQYSILTHIYGI